MIGGFIYNNNSDFVNSFWHLHWNFAHVIVHKPRKVNVKINLYRECQYISDLKWIFGYRYKVFDKNCFQRLFLLQYKASK